MMTYDSNNTLSNNTIDITSLIQNESFQEEIRKEIDDSEWANWSLKKHTFKEIKDKVLDDFENVCFTYVCETSPIPEDKVLELAALSTGLIRRQNYYKDVKTVKTVLEWKYGFRDLYDEDLRAFFRLYFKKHKPLLVLKYEDFEVDAILDLIYDRLDWIGLCRVNTFSEEFLDNFSEHIIWKELKPDRKYSDKFMKKYSELLPKYTVIKDEDSEDNE